MHLFTGGPWQARVQGTVRGADGKLRCRDDVEQTVSRYLGQTTMHAITSSALSCL